MRERLSRLDLIDEMHMMSPPMRKENTRNISESIIPNLYATEYTPYYLSDREGKHKQAHPSSQKGEKA